MKWNFWKNLDSYDFLWTNESAGVHDLVSLLVTFLSIGKRQILDIAKIGFQIEVSKWRCDWLLVNLKTFLMNSELTIITLKSLLPNSPNKIGTMSTKCWLLSKFLIKNQRLVGQSFRWIVSESNYSVIRPIETFLEKTHSKLVTISFMHLFTFNFHQFSNLCLLDGAIKNQISSAK